MHSLESVSVKFLTPFSWVREALSLSLKKPLSLALSAVAWFISCVATLVLSIHFLGALAASFAISFLIFVVYSYFSISTEAMKVNADMKWVAKEFISAIKNRWQDLFCVSFASTLFNSAVMLAMFYSGVNIYNSLTMLCVYFYVYACIFWFTPYLIVCRGESWHIAIKNSAKASMKNMIPMTLLLVLLLSLSVASAFVFIVGIFFAVPAIIMTGNIAGASIFKDQYL